MSVAFRFAMPLSTVQFSWLKTPKIKVSCQDDESVKKTGSKAWGRYEKYKTPQLGRRSLEEQNGKNCQETSTVDDRRGFDR